MSDEEDTPSASECQSLVEKFAEITNTDEALAQYFLQDNEWNLERSIEQYLCQVENGSGASTSLTIVKRNLDDPELIDVLPTKSIKLDPTAGQGSPAIFKTSVKDAVSSGQLTATPPSEFRFLTWNLDGIEPKNLKLRTKAAAKIIEKEGYDIVFLQEVTEETQNYLEKLLPQYLFVSGQSSGSTGATGSYFCVTLLKIFFVYHDSHSVTQFSNSVMGRNLLRVNAHIGKFKLVLINTHLESTADFTTQRVSQLQESLKVMNEVVDANVILAGDMNLRDKELVSAGGLPTCCFDAWIACGSKKEYQYSWDCTRNTNHQMPSKFQPRLRFDRVFVKPVVREGQIRVIDFKLTGIQKVSGTNTFPSDHWGVAVNFRLPSEDSNTRA